MILVDGLNVLDSISWSRFMVLIDGLDPLDLEFIFLVDGFDVHVFHFRCWKFIVFILFFLIQWPWLIVSILLMSISWFSFVVFILLILIWCSWMVLMFIFSILVPTIHNFDPLVFYLMDSIDGFDVHVFYAQEWEFIDLYLFFLIWWPWLMVLTSWFQFSDFRWWS